MFKTFKNFMQMNSPDKLHPTSDVMSDLSKLYFRFVMYGTDLLSTHVEKDALSSKLKYQSDTFYDLHLFIFSI